MDRSEDLVRYIMETPENTNPAVLRSKLAGIKADSLTNYYTKSETYSREQVDNLVKYATQTEKGTIRIWTTTEDNEAVLNIATENS